MNEKNKTRSSAYKAQERLVSAVSAGAFFILLGLIYVINLPSSLWDAVFNFFSSFSITQVPNTGISLLAPTNPMAHTVLYGAVFQFCIGFGILQIVFLLVRIMMNSPINKTAETIGNLVYWFGASYLVTTYLNSRTDISDWFMFWAGILVILGVSFVARAFILFIKRR